MLAPCYLIHGGEPQQTQEIISEVHHLAAKHGYNNTEVFEITTVFNWEDLLSKCQNLDLFAERTVLELRLHGETVNKQGNLALEQVLQQQDPNTCIIIRANKLKTQTLNSVWAKHIQKHGKVHVTKPIAIHLMPAWVTKRLADAGFKTDKQTIDLIAKCYEGNLLAATQFIQRVALVYAPGNLTLEQIKPFIDNNNQFTIFELTNAAFSSNISRTLNIFNTLKAEDCEPLLLLWALTREIRARQLPAAKTKLLLHIAKDADLIVKGMQPGDAWDKLLTMCLILCEKETLTTVEDLSL